MAIKKFCSGSNQPGSKVNYLKKSTVTHYYSLIHDLLSYFMAFSSPEPVVSWSRGRETRGSGSSRYRMSENF